MDFPGIQAKVSIIDRDQLLTKKVEQPYNMPPKQVFYPRSLNVKDIEGTQVGSLNTKFIKNWQLAQELKTMRQQPRDRLAFEVQYPYGDGVNYEEEMPENLKRAREMAGRNRNKLRLINTMERGGREGVTNENVPRPDDGGAHPSVQYGSETRLGYHGDRYRQEADDFKSLEKQYGDSKATYAKLRELSYKNAPITYENSAPPQDLPNIRQKAIDQKPTESVQQQPDYYRNVSRSQPVFKGSSLRQDIDERKTHLPSIKGRGQVNQQEDYEKLNMTNEEFLRDIAAKERYLKELDERIRRERAEIEAMSSANMRYDPSLGTFAGSEGGQYQSSSQIEQLNSTTNPGYAREAPNMPQNNLQKTVHFEQDEPQRVTKMNRPDNDPYGRYYTGNPSTSMQGGGHNIQEQANQYGRGAPESRQVSATPSPDLDPRVEHPPKEMFRNTDEFKNFNRLPEDQKKIYMASFLRGQKGREFTLDSNQSNKLKQLNDFYADYLGEQYKRRQPFTKDDYNYRTTVNHLKKNGIL